MEAGQLGFKFMQEHQTHATYVGYLARLTLERWPPLSDRPCSPTWLKSPRENSFKSSLKLHASMTFQYQSSLNSLPHKIFSRRVPPNTQGSWDVYATEPDIFTEPRQVPISPKMACNRLDCKYTYNQSHVELNIHTYVCMCLSLKVSITTLGCMYIC